MSSTASGEPPDVFAVRDLAATTCLDELTEGRWLTPLDPALPVVISVVRNEERRLRHFLQHYRQLGIEHFLFIDNVSEDASREILLAQPDARLFVADHAFEWRRKHGWIMHVIERIGRDRWYLSVDADEHAVYANSESLPFSDLIATLTDAGARRARAALVDMYCDTPLGANVRAPDEPLSQHYRYFDAATYSEHRNAHLTSRIGGPRMRLFASLDPDFRPQLTKYPLFRLGPDEIAYNPHAIWPPMQSREDPCLIGLLHYKFDSDFYSKVHDAVARKQYWNESTEYRVYLEALRRDPELSFLWSGSRCYTSSRDLVECGIISEPASLAGEAREVNRLADAIRRSARVRRSEQLARLL